MAIIHTNRRNTKSRFYSHLCRNLLIVGLSIGALCNVASPSLAQDSAIEAVMTPGNGEKAGQLAKNEMLVTAMKREKVDGTSVNQAMKSMRELFDFRLQRSGDRYVYRLTNSRKLAMLRYQRGNHVFETVLNAETGEYKAEIVDLTAVNAAAPARESFPTDDDGEVDVEHAAMAEQIQVPIQAETVAGEELDALEKAAPEDPILPEDAALAGKPSPDAEFPDAPMPIGIPDTEDESVLNDGMEEDDVSDESVVMPSIPKQPNRIAEENTYQNEPYRGPVPQVKQKKSTDTEVSPFATPFSMISLVMFILGLVFLAGAFFMFLLPRMKARRRLNGLGLAIRETITIAPGHTLACVELDGQGCLIAVHPEMMSFIAPCPLNDEAFWTKLQARTYWHKMAKTPISDRQLVALLAEIQKPAKPLKTLTSAPKANVSEISEIPLSEDEEMAIKDIFDEETDICVEEEETDTP